MLQMNCGNLQIDEAIAGTGHPFNRLDKSSFILLNSNSSHPLPRLKAGGGAFPPVNTSAIEFIPIIFLPLSAPPLLKTLTNTHIHHPKKKDVYK